MPKSIFDREKGEVDKLMGVWGEKDKCLFFFDKLIPVKRPAE